MIEGRAFCRTLLSLALFGLLCPVVSFAEARCYSVSESDKEPWQSGANNVDFVLPTLIALTDEPAVGFVREAPERRVRWVGRHHDYFAESNWREQHGRTRIDWGDGLNGMGFEVDADGADLVGIATPYSDVLDATYHPLVRRVRLLRITCPPYLG